MWKVDLRQRLLQAGIRPARSGALVLEIAITTGPHRNWTNLWKPLIDSLGPLLGEPAEHPFRPYDDRIVDLGLHHGIDDTLGHDVAVALWWPQF